MIPASMGLRFQIPADLETFTVTASWGVYRSQVTDRVSASGRPIRNYRRTPVEVIVPVTVADLTEEETRTVPLIDEVTLRIDARRDQGRLLVEIALCNDREAPRRIPVDAWMFQTSLSVDAGGEAVFLPVADMLTDDRWEPDAELRRLNLQYRNRLEFAVGRTCSADWDVADGARAATRVCTTWLPVSETPQTAAREIDGALLDMTRLSRGFRRRTGVGAAPDPQRVHRMARRSGRGGRDPAGASSGRRRGGDHRCPAGQQAIGRRAGPVAVRSGGAALLSVHEPGDGGPAHSHPGSGTA